nr:hypothetical protein [Tanacetum cinerariifolium]
MGYSFYYPPENKIHFARNAKFLENSLMTHEASRSLEDLEIIQEKDTHPSVNTRLLYDEDDQEIDEPQSDVNPIRRSTRTRHAPDRMCLYIDAEENDKWLFKKKTDMDGAVHTYKARLAAKGFTQTYGVDYKETFSLVADIRAIRILVAIAAFYDYKIWQMDVKTTFLNEHLFEEVYMVQPEGFVNPKFTQNRDEPCVYKKASGSNVTFLILYVDDILIMGNHIPILQDVNSYLGKCFAMKDLGEAVYILGIKIYRDRSRRLIGLYQSVYIEKILKRFHMENSKHGRSIMYVVRCTRPDVAFAQDITSRFQHNLGDLHWMVVKNIQKYLRNTKDMFLVYGGDIKRELRVSCYTDAGYLTDADDLKSQKAKYIASYDASKEAVWIRKFISGLGIVPKIKEPITMYCDNTRAITIANELGITKGVRHYRAKVHYLRKDIELGDVKI